MWQALLLALSLSQGEMAYSVRVPVAFDGYHVAPLDEPPEEKVEFQADRMFEAVNEFRAGYGLPAYVRDPGLDALAQYRAELAMADWEATGILRHDGPGGGDRYFELLPAYGFPYYTMAGENMAVNSYPDPVAEAMQRLENSPSHRTNLLGDFTKIGIGYLSHSGIHMFVQVFLSD